MFIPASSKIPSPTTSLIFCSPNFTTGFIEAFSTKGTNLLVALDNILDVLKNLPKINMLLKVAGIKLVVVAKSEASLAVLIILLNSSGLVSIKFLTI